MGKKAVILCGGCFKENEKAKVALQEADYIIGADSGAVYAQQMGFCPHYIVGDMDSLPEESKKYFEQRDAVFLTVPCEKDFTDSAFAIEVACRLGAADIVLLAATGNRIDHSLANLYLPVPLLEKAEKAISFTLIGENWQGYYRLPGEIVLNGQKGDLLSLLPLSREVSQITLENTKYLLQEESLNFGSSRGISNVFRENIVKISHKKGVLLVIHYFKEPKMG